MQYLCSGFEATWKRKSAYAVPVQRIWCESEHMRYLCSGFEATSKRKSAKAVPVQRIWCECHHMRCLCSGFEATLKRKSANAVPVQRICCESHHMRCLRSGFEEVGGMGADPLWGAGKTRIFIESERFAQAGAPFVRKPGWWAPLK